MPFDLFRIPRESTGWNTKNILLKNIKFQATGYSLVNSLIHGYLIYFNFLFDIFLNPDAWLTVYRIAFLMKIFFTHLIIDSMKLPLGLLYHLLKTKIDEMRSTISNYSTSSSFFKIIFFVLAWLFQPKAWLTFQQTYLCNVFFEKSKLIFWIVEF